MDKTCFLFEIWVKKVTAIGDEQHKRAHTPTKSTQKVWKTVVLTSHLGHFPSGSNIDATLRWLRAC